METTPDPADAASVPPCMSDALLRALWGQWKMHVVYTLGESGPSRFGALRRAIPGISPKVLTQRLREMESDGLAWRDQVNTIPPQVTYGLTPIGQEVHDVLRGFDPIAARWAALQAG